MTEAWLQAAAIAAATLVSEDLTCLAVGLLILENHVSPVLGVVACSLGIYLGDLGLWLLGRAGGRRLLRLPLVSARVPPDRIEQLAEAFDRHAPRLIVASRFLPGTRLPLYLAAGVLGRRAATFAGWTLVSVLMWTPLVVLATARYGDGLVVPLRAWFGAGPAIVVALLFLMLGLQTGRALARADRRARAVAAISRLWRWEFWPMWAFYPPVVAWVAALAARYGGFSTLAAANPGIPEGGFVGESKHEILARLPTRWTLPAVRVEPGSAARRAAWLAGWMTERGWSFPIVLKPDVGQRGVGVRLVGGAAEAEEYFASVPGPVVAQVHHPGPFEAGIFYYRFPDEARGRIFSVTDKRFPEVAGDGRSTLEQLVWRHPRYRMQAATFLRRLGPRRGEIPPPGARIRLAFAGNHAQGTMFLDGAALVTPELEARIDEIARSIPGFYVGRFDIRYADRTRFLAAEDLAIVELNGATSESTNIYDPARSLVAAYRTLFRQWSLVFRIGAANRRRGYKPAGAGRLVRLAFAHLTDRQALPVAD